MLSLAYTYIVLDIINIILNIIGCHLLYEIYRHSNRTVQQLYLINLSINLIIKNCFYLLLNSVTVVYYSIPSLYTKKMAIVFFHYCNMFNSTGVYFSYFLAMIYLTFDRLLHVLMHVRYPVFWTVSKSRKLLITSIIANCSIGGVSVIVLHVVGSDKIMEKLLRKCFYVYIPTIFNTVYLLFALMAYSIMFLKFARSRRLCRQSGSDRTEEPLLHIYLSSRFYVSVMLILSYLILMIIPSLIRAFYNITDVTMPALLALYIDISVTLCDTADGMIYIFMIPTVRNNLLKKVSSRFRCGISNMAANVNLTLNTLPRERETLILQASCRNIKVSYETTL